MKSKSNGFFILVALLVLGYLHLLVMYAQRIDSSVIRREDVTNNEKPVTLHSFIPMSSSSSSSSSTQLPINIMISQPRLDAQQVKRQMEVAYQTVPPLVKRISGHAIPTVLDTALQIDDPRWRSERILYIITPTHNRMTQMVDLQRLQQTLRLASVQYHTNIYWILIEDADVCSQRVRTIAEESGLAFAHKAIGSTVKTSSKQSKQKTTTKNNNAGHHRGLKQRNLGLETVLEVGKEGVVYFADDDNGYHVQLFTELLFTRHTSIFAVGMSGGSAYERCHVNPKTGTVDAILTTWKPKFRIPVKGKPGKFTNPKRKFGIDMAGFAFSTTALLAKKPRFLASSTAGMLETDFLSALVSEVSDLEPLAANCTRILVWHVKTLEPQYFNNPESSDHTFELMKSLL